MAAALEDPPAAPSPRRLLRRVLKAVLIVIALPAGAEAYRVVFGSNLHAVVPGQIYRCSQPSDGDLERAVAAYGVRTVVNLRGCSDPLEWYVEEARATHRLGVSQEDLWFSA